MKGILIFEVPEIGEAHQLLAELSGYLCFDTGEIIGELTSKCISEYRLRCKIAATRLRLCELPKSQVL